MELKGKTLIKKVRTFRIRTSTTCNYKATETLEIIKENVPSAVTQLQLPLRIGLGCEEAVRVMRQSHFLEKCKIAHKWAATIQETPSGRQQAAIPGVSKLARQLASTVHRWIMLNEHPVVIGGDHSCAIGTWSGLAAALRDKGNIGLIWLDAHLDAHTPDTSETG
uniref:Arginase n=1 Tax=Parascaris equorum TaxID=6256 RepID=A0A914RIV4_PAREQ